MASTAVEMCGLQLRNPIVVAGGNMSQTGEKSRMCGRAGAGAVVTKALGLGYQTKCNSPAYVCIGRQVDDPHPSATRLSTANYSLVGYSGWVSDSIEDWVERELEVAREGGAPVILNGPSGRRPQMADDSPLTWRDNLLLGIDFLVQLEKMGAAAVELPYHTPQFELLGSGISTEQMEEAIRETKKAVSIPVFVKMPYLYDVDVWARRAVEAGADGLTLTGASRVVEIDPEGERLAHPALNGYTHLAGAGQRPLALYCVAKCRMSGIQVPIMANGGVWSGLDIIKYVMAGATVVQMLSVITIQGLGAIRRINNEVKDWLDSHGYNSLDQIRGIALDSWGENYKEEFKAKVDPKRCDGCGLCAPLCERAMRGAITLDSGLGLARVDREKCTGCAYCTIICPTGALSLDGWPPSRRRRS